MISSNDIELFKDFLDSGTTKANITKITLCVIAVSALPFVVIGAGAMGNAVQIFRTFDKKENYKNRQISNAVTNLHRCKFIEYIPNNKGMTTIRITKKGETKLKSFAIDLIKISIPSKWDGKWRVVMFDLPIRYAKIRHILRFRLKQLGFVKFQKSVWIYPYSCTDEILFVAEYYKIAKHVEVMTVIDINNDLKLKKYFKLK